eukprot:11704643-Ditylum_brightwellii.AAC.1
MSNEQLATSLVILFGINEVFVAKLKEQAQEMRASRSKIDALDSVLFVAEEVRGLQKSIDERVIRNINESEYDPLLQ